MKQEPRRLGLVQLAGVALAIGWSPLLVYLVFDTLRGGGGNPIGLGLLAMVGTMVAIVLLTWRGVLALYQRFFGEKH